MEGKQHQGRNWPFGYGSQEHRENQYARLNPRGGATPADDVSGGGNGGQGGGSSGGNAGTTAIPPQVPTANPTANSPGTTQGQANNPTQPAGQGQPTNTQGANGGAVTLPSQPDRGGIVHTGLHTSILDPRPTSVIVVLDDGASGGQTTFATQYNTGDDTLAIDTGGPGFSGPQPTSGAGGLNNVGSGSSSDRLNGGSTGASSTQGPDGGLGSGAIAGIIGMLWLLYYFSVPFQLTQSQSASSSSWCCHSSSSSSENARAHAATTLPTENTTKKKPGAPY